MLNVNKFDLKTIAFALKSDLTSEGMNVSSVIRCDGVQVNTAAALPLKVVTCIT